MLSHKSAVPVVLSKFMFSLLTTANGTILYTSVFARINDSGKHMSNTVEQILDMDQQAVDDFEDYIWLGDTAFSFQEMVERNHNDVSNVYALLKVQRAAGRGLVCNRDVPEVLYR